VNVAEPLFGNSALADSLERRFHPAARTDHPDESARLHQRGTPQLPSSNE